MYKELITKLLKGADYDPRHIEAYMRLQYGTLSHLSRLEFIREIRLIKKVIDQGGKCEAEALAKSFGL